MFITLEKIFNADFNRSFIYAEREMYKRVLNEIGIAITESFNTIKSLEDSDELPAEFIDSIRDDESDFIEMMLGTAFVICQAYITHVVSHMKRFHKLAKRQNICLKTTTQCKKDILKFGCKEDNFSDVEIIDAFANYFKHRDEWAVDWEELTGQAKQTAKIIQSVGATWGCSGNLGRGAQALGNAVFNDPIIFLDKLERWYISLTDAYCSEFEQIIKGK